MAQRPPVMRSIDGISRPALKKSKWRKLTVWYRRSKVARVVTFAALVAIVTGTVFTIKELNKQPNYDDVTVVTKALSRHMILPKDEEPIIATVTDKSSLKTPFLKEADNGDRIFIYEKARRVVIYRPSIDRIVDIGPVELDNIPATTQ